MALRKVLEYQMQDKKRTGKDWHQAERNQDKRRINHDNKALMNDLVN